MALAKVLIDQTSMGGYEISWKQLSQRFLDAYIERIGAVRQTSPSISI